MDETFANLDLQKILSGQSPLTQVLKTMNNISVLTGHASQFLAEADEITQYRFLQDLTEIYPNFDMVILAIDGKNPILQKKMDAAC